MADEIYVHAKEDGVVSRKAVGDINFTTDDVYLYAPGAGRPVRVTEVAEVPVDAEVYLLPADLALAQRPVRVDYATATTPDP